tara:strand:+ start:630 stop:2447 length:1818 start_codon:yes stop_codon:yes gene_type:complete
MALTKLSTDVIDLSSNTRALTIPSGTTGPNTTDTTGTCSFPTTAANLFQFNDDVVDTCNNNNGTAVNAAYATGYFDKAYDFSANTTSYSGTSAFVTFADDMSRQNDFSWSFWLKSTGGPTNYATIISFYGSYYNYIYFNPGISNIYISLGDGGDTSFNTGMTSGSTWYHLALTKSSTNGRAFYVNGSAVFSDGNTSNGGSASRTGNAIGMHWGSGSAWQYPLNGDTLIDQFRIFPSGLTSSQVSQLYNETNVTVTSGRPTSPTEGLLRDNTTTGALEFYNGSLWQQIAGTLVPDYQPPTATGNFITTLFNGNNTTVTTGFQADLAWVSNRQYANGNFIYDSVRGASNNLWPTSNDAEGVRSGVTAFNATSTTIGTYASIGSGGSGTNVQWAWKAGGTAVSNSDGTTTSTISKNATTGFSIVKTSAAGGTINVGHGLGSDIGMIILKGVDVAEAWQVWHKDVGTGKYLQLSSTASATTRANSFSTVNSTIFENDWTGGAVVWIAYCWSSITGYSKMGSYTGTGSGNTQSINTGFEVGWIMIKDYTATGSWFVMDNERGSQNSIAINAGTAESTTNYVTFTSTGFDVTSDLNSNSSSNSFIYMAFRS